MEQGKRTASPPRLLSIISETPTSHEPVSTEGAEAITAADQPEASGTGLTPNSPASSRGLLSPMHV